MEACNVAWMKARWSTCPTHIHIHTLTCHLRVPYWWILAFIVRSRILWYGRSSAGHLSCYILSFKILLYSRATRITEELKEDIQTHSAVSSAVQRRVLVSHDGLNRVSELFPLCHVQSSQMIDWTVVNLLWGKKLMLRRKKSACNRSCVVANKSASIYFSVSELVRNRADFWFISGVITFNNSYSEKLNLGVPNISWQNGWGGMRAGRFVCLDIGDSSSRSVCVCICVCVFKYYWCYMWCECFTLWRESSRVTCGHSLCVWA